MSLPSGYKRLEYIQSTGTQYINTNFKPNNLTRVILDAQMVGATSQSTLYCPFGCRGGGLFFELYKASTANWNLTFLWGSTYRQYFSIDYSARHTFEINKNAAKVDDTQLTYSNTTFQLSYNLFIGADNDAGSKIAITPLKIYSCQIYDNGTLIRDYIPCQKPDGTIGLWDDVNSVFYGNAGTGTFTAGPIVVSQSEITELEYIQSSGTQYVDTEFKPTGSTKVVCDFQMLNQGSSQQGVFGSRPGTSGRFTVFTGNGTADLQVDYNTEQTLASVGSSITGLNVNSRTTLEVSNSLVINGTTVKTVSSASFASTYNLFLFANNNSGTAQLPGTMKLYSCQIYDNGTMIRDYIAAKLSDGTVGLYDKLNGLFYINAGTGTFEAGPVVASPSIFVNIDGIWKPINHIYVNINNIWQKST